MDLLEEHTHSFIVKVWLEETAAEAGQPTWRGHITHVPSGQRRYLKDLGDITSVITPYLESLGVEFRKRRRLGHWLGRFRECVGRALSE